MKHYILAWLLAGLILLVPFAPPAQAQEQNLAQWYDQWENRGYLSELNYQVSAAYIGITGTSRSLQELMNRNHYYWFWPDFEWAIHSMWPDYDLACVDGQSSTYNGAHIQSYYVNTDDYRYIMATMFHENIHTDVIGWAAVGNIPQLGQSDLMANGFELSEENLQYFDEAFVEILADLMMNEAGFTGYTDGGYAASTTLLRPMIQKIMERGATVQDLYNVHTRSDIEEILMWIGIVEMGDAYNGTDPATDVVVEYGYEFALDVHKAQLEVFYPPLEVTPEATSEEPTTEFTEDGEPAAAVVIPTAPVRRATCGMWLWFSPSQYELYNRAYEFPAGVWSQNEWGNWRITEEDYYAVIDSQ